MRNKLDNMAFRYFRAGMEVAEEISDAHVFVEDLRQVSKVQKKLFEEITKNNSTLYDDFLNLGFKQQSAILLIIFKECNISKYTVKFLNMMVKEDSSLGLFFYLMNNCQSLLYRYQSLLRVKVITAIPMKPEQTKSLSGIIKGKYGDGFNINQEVDPSIMGGMILYIGDKVYDDSIKQKLNNLKRCIRSE